MEYLQQFLNAYDSDVPKFSIIWLTELAHNYLNGLYQIDRSLAQFFIEFEAKLEKSFVFLMGDHGMRFTGIRDTKIGEMEDYNPFLYLSVPKSLRQNAQLMENLKLNSQKLVTHFDLYLTLMDIASISPITNFTDFSHFDWSGNMPKNRGSSILRPINSSERNCRSLDIPESYCICKRNKTDVMLSGENNTLLIEGAKFLTENLNNVLQEYKVLKQCVELNFSTLQSAEMIVENEKVFYSISYSVSPSSGIFQGLVRLVDNKSFNFTLVSTIQNRINSYGKESHCVAHERLKPICFCQDLLYTTTAESSSMVFTQM
jgi:hypothetical protein